MKCKVCGAESGKYPLCYACNVKKEQGLIIKCSICNQWHYKDADCPKADAPAEERYLYAPRKTLISKSEQDFFDGIKSCLPQGYHVFPQINLAAFIDRTDDARYHNELFRNLDFLITDAAYAPKIAVEINDQSHLTGDRRARDEKVQHILEESGIPLLKLWTSYGVNTEYIKKKITEMLDTPVVRKHHFAPQQADIQPEEAQPSVNLQATDTPPKKKQGCYVATCVYGSYDCPQVWTLRRYRDTHMRLTWYGRLFIKWYYTVSPTLVKYFGKLTAFRALGRKILDKIVWHLNAGGYDDSPYRDANDVI